MATCEEIIRSAFRRSGITALGVSISATQSAVGLERLQGMYLSMLGSGTFGRVSDYFLKTGDYTAKENQRIYKADATSIIAIPNTITDPDTGVERAPLDGALVIVIDPGTPPTPVDDQETDAGFMTDIHIYDALKGWSVINGLTPTSYAPLSGRYEEGLKDMLAVVLADDGGMPISQLLARNASMAKLRIGGKYDQRRKPAATEYF